MGNSKRKLTGAERSALEEDLVTDPSRGDTLCVCLYCGVVLVAEMVADDILALDKLKARDVFNGQPCVYCFKTRPETKSSQYRLIIGPLRPPMMEAK